VAIVKEFYANLYDTEDKSPKQIWVRGHLIKFDVDALNTFLKTPMIIEEGENLPAYSKSSRLRMMGELLQAQENKVDSPLEIMDQLALVQPMQVWAQEE